MPVHSRLTTTVSAEGHIVLPRTILRSLGWHPGTKLAFEKVPEGVLLKPAQVLEETSPSEVFGMLKWTGEPKALEEMEAGILAKAKHRHDGD